MKSFQLKSLVAAATMALSAGAFAASAGTAVTIQESSIPGAASHLFQADQLHGSYDEVLTTTATSATQGSFVTEAIFGAGSWNLAGTVLSSQLNGFGDSGYQIYVKFASIGTYNIVNGQITFTGGTGNLEVWADPSSNTKYNVDSTATGSTNHLILSTGAASTTDDILLGTATGLLSGTGNVQAGGLGTSNGNFELLFSSFVPTGVTTPTNTLGYAYFTAPRPFNLELDLNGNFQSFNPTSVVGASTSVQLLNNSANAFFLNQVPEPGALALAGIALVGTAVASRRKARKS